MILAYKLRLFVQWLLTAMRLNSVLRLSQFCDRCGRPGSRWPLWRSENEVWEMVAGNVNGHRHGCYCVECFDALARAKGIRLSWFPSVHRSEMRNV